MKEREISSNFNSLLNQHQIPSQGQLHMLQDDFLHQMFSSSLAAPFPWADDHPPPNMLGNLEEESASKQQISKLQQHLLLSSTLMLHADQNDVVDAQSFNSPNLGNDRPVKPAFNGFTDQTLNQSPHFLHPEGGAVQNLVSPASGGGSAAGQGKQRVRARRGQATDPHSIAERLRRERIAERMKALQELVPNANKTDKASMLDEIIDYVKFLQLQVKVLSMSRLGGASPSPLLPQGRNCKSTQITSKEGATGVEAEQRVAKLMEEDMGSAMQYLQGKGLCLMPVSLATAISTTTATTSLPMLSSNNPGPLSPSISVLTAQSVATISVKDTTISKLDQ